MQRDDGCRRRRRQLSFQFSAAGFQRRQSVLNGQAAQHAVGDLIDQTLGATFYLRQFALRLGSTQRPCPGGVLGGEARLLDGERYAFRRKQAVFYRRQHSGFDLAALHASPIGADRRAPLPAPRAYKS